MDLNLLLIGGTGSGKSFFVNAFERLVLFRNLDEAAEHLGDFAAPIVFYHNDVQLSEPGTGRDFHNANSAGSQTSRPVVYEYQTKTGTIRLIDTPGIGDTGGEALDEEHMARIVSCLRAFNQIHGILLFFKKSDNRFGETHKRDLLKLLSFLGKTAMATVQVVITHADALHELTEVPSVVSDLNRCLLVDIPIGGENTFFFQNSFIKYLVLKKLNRGTFSERTHRIFAEDYQESARECLRMLRKICSHTVPYEVSQYKALALARQLRASLQTLFSDAHDRHELGEIARETSIIRGLQTDKARLENDLQNEHTYLGHFSNYMRGLPKRFSRGGTQSASLMDASATSVAVTSASRSNAELSHTDVCNWTNETPILPPEGASNASHRDSKGGLAYATFDALNRHRAEIQKAAAPLIAGSTGALSYLPDFRQGTSSADRPRSSQRTSRGPTSTGSRSSGATSDQSDNRAGGSWTESVGRVRSLGFPSKETMTGPAVVAGAVLVGVAALAVAGTVVVTNYRNTKNRRAELTGQIQRVVAQINEHLNIVERLQAILREKEDLCQLEKDLDRFMFDGAVLASERSSQAEIQVTAPFSWELLNGRIDGLQALPTYGPLILRSLNAFEKKNAAEFERVTRGDVARGYMFREVYTSS